MDELIKLTFLGDIMCELPQYEAIQGHTSYGVIFDQVKHLWSDSDYVIGNLETPIAGRKLRLVYERMRFNAPDEFAMAIMEAGVSHVSLANNHILDRGVPGLNNTIDTLNCLGLDHSGAFSTKEESRTIFYKDIGGVKIAVISTTYGVNQGLPCNHLEDNELWRVSILKYPAKSTTTRWFMVRRFLSQFIPKVLRRMRHKAVGIVSCADSVEFKEYFYSRNRKYLSKVLGRIVEAKKHADVVIVLPHVGGQYVSSPGPWQKKVIEDFVKAGADLVIANHSHCPQPILYVGRALVAYGLGDFCSSPVGGKNSHCCHDESILLHCYIDARSKRLCRYETSKLRIVYRSDGVAIPVVK